MSDEIVINEIITQNNIDVNDIVIQQDVNITPEGSPVVSVNSRIGAVVLNSSDVGLNLVDNTSDLDKPVSNATLSALNVIQSEIDVIIPELDSVYNNVNTLSGNWDTAYSYVIGSSGIEQNQQEVSSFLNANSANIINVDTIVNSTSGNWNNVYNTVQSNSALNWNYQGTDVKALTGNWNGGNIAFTNLTSNSAAYLSAVDLSLVNSTSGNWNTAYTNLISNSAAYLSAVNLSFLSVSGNWNSTYSTVQSNSATTWNYQGTDLKALSGNWQGGNIAFTNLTSNSAAYLSAVDLTLINSTSGNWNNVYNTVQSNSALKWNYQGTDIKALTGNWNGGNIAYTNLTSNSAAYLSAVDLSLVNSTSGNWNSTYSTVQGNSAVKWNYQGTDIKALTGNWNGGNLAYTNLTTNSAAYLSAVDLSFLSVSGNWNSVYSNVNSNSANYATYNYVNNGFLPLSGGIISGATRINNNLTVFGNLTATGTTTFANTIFSTTSSLSVLHVGSGPALWVGNNGDGDIASFYDIDQGIEVLHVGGINSTNPNVGVKTSTPNVDFTVNGQISANNIIWDANGNSNNWNNVYSNVQSNSSTTWNYQGTDLKSLSGNWNGGNIAFTNLTSNSAAYLSAVDLTLVNSTSGNWDSTYSTVQSNSATTWNYQGTDLKSLSGNWDGGNIAFTNLISNSAAYLSAVDLTLINSTSGNWNDAYSYVTSNSGIESDQQLATTWVIGNSANSQSIFSTVQSNSATTWNYQGTDLKALSGNWDGGNIAYTNLISNSAAYLSAVDLSLVNSTSGNWDSTYSTVQSNSATTWNYQGTDLKALSGNWQNASDALDYIIASSNFNAIVNRKYIVDTTSTSVSGILPASPAIGDYILFVDSSNTWGVRPLILNNNGNLLQTFNEPLTANISGYQFQLVYVGGSYGWKIV
jgi:uncharacterized metal-binding protein